MGRFLDEIMEKISVIIPVYDSEKYIGSALESVLAQSYPNLEVIAVDDGSSDQSLSVLHRYVEKDSRVRVFSCPHKGIGATRNFGLLQAKGEWICFVDADDLLHPQCLEFAIRAAQKEQAEFVSWLYQNFTGVPLIKELSFADLLLVNTAFPLFYTFDKSQPCIHSFVVWGKLYRKTLLKDVTFEENSLVEDVPFVYEILNKRPHTVVIGQPLYYYRYRENSFSNIPTSLAKLKHYEQAILKVLAIFKKPEDSLVLQKTFVPKMLKDQLYRCRHSLKDNQKELFALLADEVINLRNNHQISWRYLGARGTIWFILLIIWRKYFFRR